MKQLIDHIQKSIWSPSYYDTLLTQKASFSWKYYGSFTLLLAVLMTIVTSLPLIPKLNTALRELPGSFLAYYPDELEVRVNKGHVSTNVQEPYYLPLPKGLSSVFEDPTKITSLAVIDTKTPVTLAQLLSFRSMFWVSENSVAYRVDEQDNMSEFSLTPDASFTVNKQKIRNIIDRVTPYFHFAPPTLVVLIFLAYILRFVINLSYLIIASLLVFLIGKILKRKWSYGTSYRISLHAGTLPLLVESLFALPLMGIHLPFMFTALFLAVVILNYRNPVQPSPAPSPVD